ncbi:hypothetical protein EUV02_03895 [Polymorphobacter arshaanensis]|uniref:Uncharacterized protein n=1 Tax=Glacieibacterium arshaanense TaxID=2511025 RepID=A0A4Y9ESK9_9SPHN|nr:hypothetical protein [Polymorphobacter arshaanensis]TFU06163.1 hypothetical protein EUV02_03895 [Polymorphobacter arshaanensis]
MTFDITRATDRLVLDEPSSDGMFSGHIVGHQVITDEFMKENEELRTLDGQKFRKNTDAILACRIPEAVFNKWCRQGFNILSDKNITVPMILARLRLEALDGFITTNKRF